MYDVIFIGRLHHQKGILELMDIWKYMGEYSLVVVGTGYLMEEALEKARGNIEFVGEKYGKDLEEIILNCRVAVHPAIYDSGGMALAKAMSYGLPGVSFDLPSLASYYPSGVVKVPCFDLERFADSIKRLLENGRDYRRISKEAKALVDNYWKWDKRAEDIWNEMYQILYGNTSTIKG